MTIARKIRIVHIASGDLWAGAEVQLYTLCLALSKLEEITVNAILLNHGTLEQQLKSAGIPVTVLDESKLNAWKIFWRIIAQLRALRPGIVHTHRLKENILGGIAARLLRIPSLRTVHGAPEHHPGWLRPHKSFLNLMEIMIGRHAQSAIVAVSEELKTRLVKIYPDGKLHVIQNGVDLESLATWVKTPKPTPDNNTAFKVGLIGRLVTVKRVDLFLQIAGLCRQIHPELSFRFHIYGDGPLRSELEALARRLAVDDMVTFEGHCQDIHRHIASLDALVITSDHEGLPITLLEAMALGTPVVAHAVGGIPATCNAGECCWLVTGNTAEDYAQILVSCLTGHANRSQVTQLAQKRIKAHFNAKDNAQNYAKIYTRLTSRH